MKYITFEISSDTVVPCINPGDTVYCSRIRAPKPGDVVIVGEYPNHRVAYYDPADTSHGIALRVSMVEFGDVS